MKVALCLSGLIGGFAGRNGSGAQIPVQLCKDEWQYALFNNYDTDIFIHSWDLQNQKAIVDKFKPVVHKFEKQKYFNPKLSDYNHKVSSIEDLKNDIRYRDIAIEYTVENLWKHMNYMMFQTHSKYYSNLQVVNLKKEYEDKNNFKYDVVIMSRFDMHFAKAFDFENLNTKYFYASPRTDRGLKRRDYDIALHDLFFFSNSENIDLYSKQFNNIYDLCISQPHAAWEMANQTFGKENIKHYWHYQSDYNIIRQAYSANIIKNYLEG